MENEDGRPEPSKKLGYNSSILLTIITIVTFGLAMTAIPNSGAFCPGDCFEYPYLDTLSEYPNDYLWMFSACILMIIFMVYVVSIHSSAPEKHRIYTRISVAFAIISTVVLSSCYFLQFTVIPASLMNEETEGIPLMTQYNPHGIFLALEEFGYIMMSFTFLFLAPVFTEKRRIAVVIRWIYIIAFVLAVVSFAYISIRYGMGRQDRFEVIVISLNWLVLIVNGLLTGIFFRSEM